MTTALLWSLGVFAALFLLVLGAEAVLSAAGGDSDWYRSRTAWMQPLIAAAGGGGAVFVLWMVVLGIKAALT